MMSPHGAPTPPLIITLEMTRARAAGDPHAFAAGAQSYLLREAGGVYHGFELVWDHALAEDLYALSRPRTPREVVERLGARLRDILQLVAWERHDEAIGRARAEGRRVIVDVLSAAAELYTLPWELVPLRSSGARLAELPDLLVRYAWPATATQRHPERPVGGKLLFVWSDAAAPVPWSEQEQVIREAVSSLRGLTPLDVEVLPRANPARLKQALESKPSIVHILCHGRSGAEGGLVLHDALGHDEEVVTAQALGALLAPSIGSLQQLVLCACGSGAWSSVASPLGSLAQVAHRLGVPSVVAFRIPVTIDGAQVVTEALYDGLLRRLSSLEDAHLNAQSALVKRESLDWAALQLLARAEDGEDTRPVLIRPYRGLLPFRRAHRPLYFGCERVIDEVVRELDALVKTPELPDLLFLAGASGVGKSSLLNAGVLPALEERWPGLVIRSMRPGPTPLGALTEAVEGLAQGPRLLVIDQLEELFTNGAPRDELTAFAARLWEILGSGVRCIAAIRGDYLDRLGEIAVPGGRRLDSYAYDDAHRVFIGRLRPDELREAIVRPAAVVGLQFEPGLVERVLEDIGEEPGALPLVQHCMDQLWEHREGRIFTLQAYEVEIGGVDGALSRHADSVLKTLSEPDQRLGQRLLCELVVYRGEINTATRQRLPLAHLHRELRDEAAIARVLDVLVNARLLVRDEGDARHPATIEIAHEALVRRWPTLGQWLAEGAEARAARDWLRNLAGERVREPSFVLQGAQLVAAAEIRQRFSAELSDELLAFIAASEAAEADRVRREREARDAEVARIAAQARRAARALMVSVVVGIVVLGLIGYGLKQRRDEKLATLEANRAKTEARAEKAVALKAKEDAETAQKSAEVSKAVADAAIADAEMKRREAEDAVIRRDEALREANAALARAAAARAAADEAAARAAASLAALEVTRQALVKEEANAKAQKLLRVVSQQPDPTLRALLLREIGGPLPTESWLTLTFGLADTPIARQLLNGLSSTPTTPRFSQDGRRLIAGSEAGEVVVWDVETGDVLFQLDLSEVGAVQDVSLSPEGEQLMAWTVDGVARVWAVGQQEPLVSLEVGLPNGPVQMSPDWGFIARLGKEGVAYKSVQTGKRGAVKMRAVDALGLDGFVWVQGSEALMMWDAERYEVVEVATGALQSSGRHPGVSVKGVLLDENALACLLTPVPGGELSTTPLKEGVKCKHDYLTPEAASQLGVVWSRSYTPPPSVYQAATTLKGDHRAVASGSGVIHLYDTTNNHLGLLARTSEADKHERVVASDVVLVTKLEQESLISRHEVLQEGSSVPIRSLDARCARAVCTDDGAVCVLSQCADELHGALLVSDVGWGDTLTQIADPPSWIYDIAISPQADQLAIGTQDVVLFGPVVQSSTPITLRALPLSPGERAMQVIFPPDGQSILVATDGSTGARVQRCSLEGSRTPLFQLPDTEQITALEVGPGDHCVAFGLTGRIGRWCEGDLTPQLEPQRVDDYPVTSLHLAPDGETLIVGSASGNRLVNAAGLSGRLNLPTCGLTSPSVIVDSALTSAFLFNNSATCVVPLTAEAWRETLWDASDECLTPDQRLSLGLGDAQEVESAYQACLTRVNLPPRP